MEIYKDLSNPASQEFEKLLNSQLSKIQIEEGKIIEGKINKITEKFVFLFVEGLKSEPVLDVNEVKSMGLADKIKVGETIKVLLERIEDKNGEVVVSASKAHKIAGWEKLIEAYEKNEPIMGKITSKCKGGAIVEHIDTGSLMFLPGSQISDKPLKDISHLMNEPQKFALIKLDKVRGNACVSRREIISSPRPMLLSSLTSRTGSLFKPSTNKKTNFSVILLILPSMILPSSIWILESWLFSNFSNSCDAGFERSLYISIKY